MLWESAQRRTTAGTCWAGLAAIRGQQPAIHCSPPLQCLLPACSFGADCQSQKCCLSNGSTCLPQDNSTFIPDNFAALPGVGLIVSKLCCSGVCDLTTKACTDVSMSVGVAGALQTSPRLVRPPRSCAPPPPPPLLPQCIVNGDRCTADSDCCSLFGDKQTCNNGACCYVKGNSCVAGEDSSCCSNSCQSGQCA